MAFCGQDQPANEWKLYVCNLSSHLIPANLLYMRANDVYRLVSVIRDTRSFSD